jgi:two-component system, LytTR family, response regulator
MNIRTLIVDDEAPARKRVKRLLNNEPDISVIAECGSGSEAINVIQNASLDLLFLDVQMPEVGGFDVVQSIHPERMPIIIFVTAYDEHALRAFDVHALDYLLKPFKQERFKEAVNRAKTRISQNEVPGSCPGLAALIQKLRAEQNYLNRFIVKSSSRVVLVSASEVDWIESAANYALLHSGDKTHIVRETMHALETKLSPNIFQRISRSVIVNLERVKELQPMGKGQYVIILTNGKQLTMSRGIRDLEQAVQSR